MTILYALLVLLAAVSVTTITLLDKIFSDLFSCICNLFKSALDAVPYTSIPHTFGVSVYKVDVKFNIPLTSCLTNLYELASLLSCFIKTLMYSNQLNDSSSMRLRYLVSLTLFITV